MEAESEWQESNDLVEIDISKRRKRLISTRTYEETQ